MTTTRSQPVGDLFPTRKQEDGTYLCSVCGGAMKYPRSRRYCSNACRDIAYVASNPGHARMMVRRRDKGVCANCGCDTEKIERILRRAYKFGTPGWSMTKGVVTTTRILRQMGFKTEHLWEMDHILPVIEGGLSEMGNLRTLCMPCHRADTKELAGRRASMRQTMPLFARTK